MKYHLSTVLVVLTIAFSVQAAFGAPPPDYKLTVHSAVIADLKVDANPWDVGGGRPDPYVVINVVDGDTNKKVFQITADVCKDTLRPVWNQPAGIVKVGDRISLQVWDNDIAFDDVIGKDEFKLSEEQIAQGTFTRTFQQVKEVTFSVVPVNPVVVVRAVPPAPVSPPVPVVIIPPQPDPALEQRRLELANQRDSARQSIEHWDNQIRDLNNKVVVAQVAMIAAKKVYDDAPAGSFEEIAAQIAYIAADRTLAEFRSELGRAAHNLGTARSRFDQLRE